MTLTLALPGQVRLKVRSIPVRDSCALSQRFGAENIKQKEV